MEDSTEVRIHAIQRTYRINSIELWVGSVLGRQYCIVAPTDGSRAFELTRSMMAQLIWNNRRCGLQLINRTPAR